MSGSSSVAESRVAWFFRRLVVAVAGAQTLYWLYTFRLIFMNADPLGDGFEYVAIVPFGVVFLALVAPSLWLASGGRMLPLSAALGVAGLVLNVLLFIEIASELTGGGSRTLRF
jgi:hypothetical protein